MGVAMDVDGVFDFDVRRMNNARLVLRARGIGRDATFMGRRGNNVAAHGFSLLGLAGVDVATVGAPLSKRIDLVS
jgi:hypothetical protein